MSSSRDSCIVGTSYAPLAILAMACLFEHALPITHARAHGVRSRRRLHTHRCVCWQAKPAPLPHSYRRERYIPGSCPDVTIPLSQHTRLLTSSSPVAVLQTSLSLSTFRIHTRLNRPAMATPPGVVYRRGADMGADYCFMSIIIMGIT